MSTYGLAYLEYQTVLYHAMLSITLFAGLLVLGWWALPIVTGNWSRVARWVYLAGCVSCYVALAVLARG